MIYKICITTERRSLTLRSLVILINENIDKLFFRMLLSETFLCNFTTYQSERHLMYFFETKVHVSIV